MNNRWPTRALEDAGVTLIDCIHKTPKEQPSGYPYVTIPQMKDGFIDIPAARCISETDFETWTEKARPKPHDVVLSRRCNPGVTAHVPPGTEFALGQNLVLMRADGAHIYPPFLRWLMRSRQWWGQVNKYINVGATFDSLRCAEIPTFELPVPPLKEQKALAQILGTLDSKIELNRQTNKTLESIARALFKSWFVDFDPVRVKRDGINKEGDKATPFSLSPDILDLFPDSFQDSELGEIPVGWECVKIESVASKIAMGPFGSRITRSNFVESGVPIIRGNNLTKGFVDKGFVYLTDEKAEELATSSVTSGDLVFTHRGTLGQVGLIPGDSRFPRYIVSQSQMLLKANCDLTSGNWLYHFFENPIGMQRLLANTSQTGVPAISRPTTSLKAIDVTVPPRNVVNLFDEILAPNARKITALKNQTESLVLLRDTLLPKLISGELRIKDAEKFLADAPV